LVPQEQFSPHKTPLPLQIQPVIFPLAAVFSLRIHCDLHEQFTAGWAIVCKIYKLYLSVVAYFGKLVSNIYTKKQSFTSLDSSDSSSDESIAISLSTLWKSDDP
jgi:hypothetical protein